MSNYINFHESKMIHDGLDIRTLYSLVADI